MLASMLASCSPVLVPDIVVVGKSNIRHQAARGGDAQLCGGVVNARFEVRGVDKGEKDIYVGCVCNSTSERGRPGEQSSCNIVLEPGINHTLIRFYKSDLSKLDNT